MIPAGTARCPRRCSGAGRPSGVRDWFRPRPPALQDALSAGRFWQPVPAPSVAGRPGGSISRRTLPHARRAREGLGGCPRGSAACFAARAGARELATVESAGRVAPPTRRPTCPLAIARARYPARRPRTLGVHGDSPQPASRLALSGAVVGPRPPGSLPAASLPGSRRITKHLAWARSIAVLAASPAPTRRFLAADRALSSTREHRRGWWKARPRIFEQVLARSEGSSPGSRAGRRPSHAMEARTAPARGDRGDPARSGSVLLCREIEFPGGGPQLGPPAGGVPPKAPARPTLRRVHAPRLWRQGAPGLLSRAPAACRPTGLRPIILGGGRVRATLMAVRSAERGARCGFALRPPPIMGQGQSSARRRLRCCIESASCACSNRAPCARTTHPVNDARMLMLVRSLLCRSQHLIGNNVEPFSVALADRATANITDIPGRFRHTASKSLSHS